MRFVCFAFKWKIMLLGCCCMSAYPKDTQGDSRTSLLGLELAVSPANSMNLGKILNLLCPPFPNL